MSKDHRTYGRHKGCGGFVVEDWTKTYEHEGATYPSYRCTECDREILGDAQIELEEQF